MAFTPRVFSGMQPTGNLHLGNYLGAMVKWVEMQKTHECIFCVVDMHAITMWQDPAELKDQIRSVTAAYIAAGIDPKTSILFNQSQVPEHAELAWVFLRGAAGLANRMTQFKERPAGSRTLPSASRLSGADDAESLASPRHPRAVGDDQSSTAAHDIAKKFNRRLPGQCDRRAGRILSAARPSSKEPPRSCPCATAPRRCRSRTRPISPAST
jgi:tryptophanyl-tRNA synthetase